MSKDSSVFAGSECTKAKFKMRERGRGKVEEKKKECGDASWRRKKVQFKREKRERKREREDINRISNLKSQARSTTRFID